jgi:hypothetical protein
MRWSEHVEKLNAVTADDAVAKRPELRRLVSEVRASYEADPVIEQIRKVAEARILKGKGPVEIPAANAGKA